MLLCRVGVGRAAVFDEPEGPRVIPPGYDSLYVGRVVDTDGDGLVSAEEFEVAATHGGRPPSAYSHKYIVLDGTQVLPAYLVSFKYTPGGSDRKKCDVCEAAIAVFYCESDKANLCADCDEETHSANKLVGGAVCVCMRCGCCCCCFLPS